MEKRQAKADFLTAFWKLYEKKEVNKISVGELCRLAGYNRTTFYVYYDNIYDLLDKAVEHIFLPIKEELLASRNFADIFGSKTAENIFLAAFKREEVRIELLFRHQDYLLLAEKMKGEILSLLKAERKDSDLTSLAYLIEYQISALFGVMNHWFQAGKVLSEKDLVEMVYDISTSGAISLIRKELLKNE